MKDIFEWRFRTLPHQMLSYSEAMCKMISVTLTDISTAPVVLKVVFNFLSRKFTGIDLQRWQQSPDKSVHMRCLQYRWPYCYTGLSHSNWLCSHRCLSRYLCIYHSRLHSYSLGPTRLLHRFSWLFSYSIEYLLEYTREMMICCHQVGIVRFFLCNGNILETKLKKSKRNVSLKTK